MPLILCVDHQLVSAATSGNKLKSGCIIGKWYLSKQISLFLKLFVEACSLLARNIPEHAFTLGHPWELLTSLLLATKFSQLSISSRVFFGGSWKKKIVKFRIGENYLAEKFSFICLVTFQYLPYDTKIRMGGGWKCTLFLQRSKSLPYWTSTWISSTCSCTSSS